MNARAYKEILRTEWHKVFWFYISCVIVLVCAYLLLPVSSPGLIGSFLLIFAVWAFVYPLAFLFPYPRIYTRGNWWKKRRSIEEFVITRGMRPSELLILRYLFCLFLISAAFALLMVLTASGARGLVQELVHRRYVDQMLKWSQIRHLYCCLLMVWGLSSTFVFTRFSKYARGNFAKVMWGFVLMVLSLVLVIHYYDLLYHLGLLTCCAVVICIAALIHAAKGCRSSDWVDSLQ